jgi:hypothetical protein
MSVSADATAVIEAAPETKVGTVTGLNLRRFG